jgi:WD40 repeat protein
LGEVFISHASADRVMAARVAEGVRLAGHSMFLDTDREDGIVPGAAWQRTLMRELRICDSVVFLNSRAAQASMWCHSELVVATELGKRIYSLDLGPDLPPHPLLGSLQRIGFDPAIDASIRRLTGSLELDGPTGSARLRWERGRPPYPGLAAMDVADAGVFFGREDEVRDLMARVDGPLGQRDGDLVVVMGPSGAGKSSLVRAGLAARLAVPQSGWAVARPFEPGIRPLDRLLSQLSALMPGQLTDDECRDRVMNQGLAAFGDWLAAHAMVPAKRLLLTVDQAEQLATVTPAREGEEFLGVLGGGLGAGSPVTVVMTVRSDRFDEIQRLSAIGPAIRAPFVVAPLTRAQLAVAIESPARRADLTFEPGLVSRLIDDASRGGGAETADALPFLAFVLREMYDLVVNQDRTVFTAADYEQVGRIDGAIIRRAQAAEASLLPGSEPVLERLLPRFVTLSEERLPAARPVPRELLTAAEQPIIERLEDQRLVVGTGDTVRLAHERLIDAWPRLASAVAERRDDLLLEARLERQAADWQYGHGELLGREAASDASSWLARQAELATNHAAVGEYVRASRAALRRRRAQLVSVLSVIVVLAIAASAVAVTAVIQRSDAVSQSRLAQSEEKLAQSEEMAAEATSLLPKDAPLAMLLSLQAYERAPTVQAESALIQAAQQPLDDLLQSGSTVESVAFSPDGHTLAVGDDAGHIGLWDVTTGRRTASLNEGSEVNSVAFSPDGQTVAAGDESGAIGVWDTATGRQTASLTANDIVNSVAFSPDGHTLAAGDNSGAIGVWDLATGSQTAILVVGGTPVPIVSVAFSRDGHTLAAGDFAGHIGLWDTATGRKTGSMTDGSTVNSVAFSPDGRTLAAGDDNGHIGLWDTATGRETASLADGSPVVQSVAFSPDGRTLAAGDDNGHIGLWDTATGRETASLADGSTIDSVAFSPDGRTLAGGDFSGDVGVWSTAAGQATASLADGNPVESVAFSPDGRTLAAGDFTGHIVLWDTATGRRTATLPDGDPVYGVAFSPDGRTLVAGDTVGNLAVWDVATGRKTASLSVGDGSGAIDSVAFSPDGRTLAAGGLCGDTGVIGVWDTATWRQADTLADGSSTVLSVAFSPDGRTLAAGDDNGHIGLWDTATGRKTDTLADGSAVHSVAFSPDGRTLAAGDDNGHIGLWDTTTGRKTDTLADGSAVHTVAFGSNSPLIVSGDYSGNVEIWNAANGQQLARLGENGTITSVMFSAHDQILAIGGLNNDIVLLRLNQGDLNRAFFRHLICAKVRENMTRAQWAQYAPGQPYQRTCS